MDKHMIVRMVGAVLGILIGVLMLTIGFWRTLLLVALAALGWYLSASTVVRDKLIALRQYIDAMRSTSKDS